MFLSRMPVNPARRGSRKLISSPQAMHAAVMAAFVTDSAVTPGVGRILWRTDIAGPKVMLYVLSPQQPDFTHIVEQAGWPTTQAWETRDYTGLLSKLDADQLWGFRLTANPVHNVRKGPGEQTRRVPHVTADQQLQWLLDRCGSHGFEIPTNSLDQPDVVVHSRDSKQFRRGDQFKRLNTATFDGHLRVTDPEKLRIALTHGLGHGKAYGCGLITLAKP